MPQNLLEGLLKHSWWAPPPKYAIQQVWGGTWEFELLPRSQWCWCWYWWVITFWTALKCPTASWRMAIHSCNELKVVVAGLGNFIDITQGFWFLFPIEKPILNCPRNWVQIKIWPDLAQPTKGQIYSLAFSLVSQANRPPVKEPTSCLYLHNLPGGTAGLHEEGWENPMTRASVMFLTVPRAS